MAWKRLRPVRGIAARVTGPVVTIGKNGNLYFSADLAEKLDISTDKAAAIHWDSETKELGIVFMDREGRDRSRLFADGLLAVVKQGGSYQLTTKSVLGQAGIPIPEKATRFTAEVRETQLEVGTPKQKAAVVNVAELLEEEAAEAEGAEEEE